jgi:hypothetical protein
MQIVISRLCASPGHNRATERHTTSQTSASLGKTSKRAPPSRMSFHATCRGASLSTATTLFFYFKHSWLALKHRSVYRASLRRGNSLGLDLGSDRFESRPGHWLFWHRYSWFSSVLPIFGILLQLGFLPHHLNSPLFSPLKPSGYYMYHLL